MYINNFAISFVIIFIFCMDFVGAQAQFDKHKITSYTPVFRTFYEKDSSLKIAIRSFEQESIRHLLVVDPYTLKTQVVKATDIPALALAIEKIEPSSYPLTNTPFIQALTKYNAPPYKLQNYGATAALYQLDGVFLTIDMCPSKKSFEKTFFEKLAKMHEKNLRSTPIAIAISGLWIINHMEEFIWLKEQSLSGKLDITWVNHSFSHPYIPEAPLEHNFLLKDEEQFEEEVLQTEITLLENNITPSIFFRYPGLVSNENLVKKLNRLSLIPVGSNAWLAKDEKIIPGAFILVHGNSNEPKGIEVIEPLLDTLNLLPLPQAFIKL